MSTHFLKPLRLRLEETAKQGALRLGVIEQDYVLSWLLVGIFSHEDLRSTLVFKGGTGLKKGYFGDYRFSEDLDFSAYPGAPQGEALFKSLSEACAYAETRVRFYAPREGGDYQKADKGSLSSGQKALEEMGFKDRREVAR